MTQQFKVVKNTNNSHTFTIGEVVTLGSTDSQEYQFFSRIGSIIGLDETPEFKQCQPYVNDKGQTQVLQDDDVVAL